jgi:glycosyltransferase involved in cell wall biosynthesis
MTVLIYSYGIPSDKYPMNGIFAFDQARALASLGHNVIMAVLDLRSIRRKRKLFLDLYDKSDVHVVHFSFPIGVMPSKLHDFIDRILGSILIKFSCRIFSTPDIIHSHFLRQSYTVSKTFNGHRPRLFSTIHDGHLMNGINKSERSKLDKIKSNSTIITVSPKLSEVLASNSISSVILNNMIDESIFRHSFNSINVPKANVVSAGALDDNKGMKDLIFAWKELPSWILTKLIILGDGPKRKEIEELIISFNLNDRVKIVGAYDRHQFAEYLNTSKFFILVSKKESFGVVYAEALMHGVPVIATKCGGPESLVNETNGLLIDVGNHSQLVDAIITMEKKYNEFDSATISRDIMSAYGTRVVTQKLIEIYSDSTNIS